MRLGSGLSLLLLLIAQAKACPSIDSLPAHSQQPAASIPGTPSGEQPRDKNRRSQNVITIYHALPSLPDYRRTANRSSEASHGAEVFGGHAEISAVGPVGPLAPTESAEPDLTPWWSRFAPCIQSPSLGETDIVQHQISQLLHLICPQGPPSN